MMNRRTFITLIGSAAAAWPLVARAQQRERMRRIGVLVSSLAADDPEWQARGNAFVQGLQERSWSDGRNVRVEYRWGLGDPDRLRKYAAELVARSESGQSCRSRTVRRHPGRGAVTRCGVDPHHWARPRRY